MGLGGTVWWCDMCSSLVWGGERSRTWPHGAVWGARSHHGWSQELEESLSWELKGKLGVEEESDLTSQSPSSLFAPWTGRSARTGPCGLLAVGPDLPSATREHPPKESCSGNEHLLCVDDPWVTVFLKTEGVGAGTDRQAAVRIQCGLVPAVWAPRRRPVL